MPGLNVSSHPLIAHKMTILRDEKTSPQEFRRVLKEITFYLGYEVSFEYIVFRALFIH